MNPIRKTTLVEIKMNGTQILFSTSLFSALIILLLYSCKSYRIPTKDTSLLVHAVVLQRTPYCGGAKPSKEKEKGTLSPIVDQVFFVKSGSQNADTIEIVQEIKTNAQGKMEMHLPPGEYGMIFPEKHQPFTDFLRNQSRDSQDFKAASVECFQNWWQAPDATFRIDGEKPMDTITIEAYCYTNFNPCLTYVGPKRP